MLHRWNTIRTALPLAVSLAWFGCSERPAEMADYAPGTQPRAGRPSVPGVHGLAATGNPLASMAGIRILMQGGNAADAAVAIHAVLHVVEPQSSGTGGNGFMTIYDKATDRVYSLGATGAAPKALRPDAVTAETLLRGIQAGCVPGLFGGWIAMLDRFGTLSLAQVLAPAIEYAENGVPIERTVAGSIQGARAALERFPTSMAMFLPGGRVPEPGELFRMPDLAATFKRVLEAEEQALKTKRPRSEALRAAFDRFYKGDIAREMARFYQENGGIFRWEDFAAYEPIWAEPVHTTYRGYDIYTSPPTSRGGLEVAMQLNLIEEFDVKALGHNTAEALHLIIECIKVAKADVYRYVADPRFTDVPMAGLLSKEYAASRRALIDRNRAGAYPEHGNPPRAGSSAHTLPAKAAGKRPLFAESTELGGTTSFSVADRLGNVIACTPTHGGGFGTCVVVGNTGLTFNNGTRIGATSPYPEDVNYLRGGQIPLLNNSPIIVLKDGQFFLALGTPGGETIGQTQFQALLNILDFEMPMQEAMEAARLALVAEPNFYRPGIAITVNLENRVDPKVVRALEAKGHKIALVSPWSLGSMQGIRRDPVLGTMYAGADPRRVAYAVGW